MLKYILIFLISSGIVSSCYVSKNLDRDVKIKLDESFIVTITNTGNSNFSNKYTQEEYKQAFLSGMKNEFSYNHIIVDENNPEFAVSISELKINESTKTETVNDSDSPDNGKVFELTSLDLYANGLVDQISKTNIKEWSADKEKDEKVTNNRSAGQIVTGTNKDNKLYREKEFSDNEAKDLAENCGRRSATRIINTIIKFIK